MMTKTWTKLSTIPNTCCCRPITGKEAAPKLPNPVVTELLKLLDKFGLLLLQFVFVAKGEEKFIDWLLFIDDRFELFKGVLFVIDITFIDIDLLTRVSVRLMGLGDGFEIC